MTRLSRITRRRRNACCSTVASISTCGWPSSTPCRAGYYGVLAACSGLILWRPGWAAVIGVCESPATLIALILSMALPAMFLSDPTPGSRPGPATVPEIVKFLLAGSIANHAWLQGLRALRDDPPRS